MRSGGVLVWPGRHLRARCSSSEWRHLNPSGTPGPVVAARWWAMAMQTACTGVGSDEGDKNNPVCASEWPPVATPQSRIGAIVAAAQPASRVGDECVPFCFHLSLSSAGRSALLLSSFPLVYVACAIMSEDKHRTAWKRCLKIRRFPKKCARWIACKNCWQKP